MFDAQSAADRILELQSLTEKGFIDGVKVHPEQRGVPARGDDQCFLVIP
jgi:hypothetical protein